MHQKWSDLATRIQWLFSYFLGPVLMTSDLWRGAGTVFGFGWKSTSRQAHRDHPPLPPTTGSQRQPDFSPNSQSANARPVSKKLGRADHRARRGSLKGTFQTLAAASPERKTRRGLNHSGTAIRAISSGWFQIHIALKAEMQNDLGQQTHHGKGLESAQ